MSTRVMIDGNGAASEALRLAKIKVISAYPITPQSSISEKLAEYVAQGKLDAKYIRVESEHSAMSAAIGAQLTGVRAGTATSSVGLALMHECLGVAAGCRVPIVMPVVNRSLVSPWSLWCDHQDSMAERIKRGRGRHHRTRHMRRQRSRLRPVEHIRPRYSQTHRTGFQRVLPAHDRRRPPRRPRRNFPPLRRSRRQHPVDVPEPHFRLFRCRHRLAHSHNPRRQAQQCPRRNSQTRLRPRSRIRHSRPRIEIVLFF